MKKKKHEQKQDMCKKIIQHDFITKTKQGCDKKMYSKLMSSRLKVLPLFIPFKDLT